MFCHVYIKHVHFITTVKLSYNGLVQITKINLLYQRSIITDCDSLVVQLHIQCTCI